jgi:hypothetical protein
VGTNDPSSSYEVGRDVDINIIATANPHYAFESWTVTGEGASVGNPSLANTYFTMGTENATLTANFAEAHLLTLAAAPAGGGTFRVNGTAYTGPIWVAPGALVSIVANPASNYSFVNWTVSGHDSSVIDPELPTTHFIMGDEDATLTATFIYNNRNSNR